MLVQSITGHGISHTDAHLIEVVELFSSTFISHNYMCLLLRAARLNYTPKQSSGDLLIRQQLACFSGHKKKTNVIAVNKDN